MSARDGKVLDANLAQLLQRAYVPALPRASYRDALRAEWMENVRRSALKRAEAALQGEARRRSERRPRLRLVLTAAAAAVLFFLFLFLREVEPETAGPATILARGAIALETTEGWQSVQADASLPRSSDLRAVHTPPGAGVTLVGSADRLRLEADTVAALRDEGSSALEVTLEQGGVSAERAADGGAWLLHAGAATLRFEHGKLSVAYDAGAGNAPAGATARLQHGAAFLLDGENLLALEAGGVLSLDLSSGGPASPLGADPAGPTHETPRSADRSPVAGLSQEDEDDVAPSVPHLRGRVTEPDGSTPETFTVGLLPVRRGNDFYATELFHVSAATEAAGAAPGAFLCDGLRPRAYDIFVHAPGFALLHAGRHELGPETGLDLGTLELRAGNAVRGLLVDAVTHTPVTGAQIVSENDCGASGLPFDPEQVDTWLPIAAHSGAGGGFELSALNHGSHRLRISAPGFAPRWIEVEVHADRVTELEPVLLNPGAVLIGTAFGADGLPLQGARLVVTMMDESAESMTNFALAETDTEGRYRVEDLPPGPLLAIYLGLGREPSDVRPVQVRGGAETVLDFGQPPVGTQLTGTVTGSDGKPLAQRNLTLFDEAAENADADWMATSSDTNGHFAFEGVAPGRYHLLEVDRFGRWLSLIAVLDVPDWPEVHHDLVRADQRVEGRVTSTLGEESPEAWVLLGRMQGDREAFAGFVRVSEDGHFAWSGLPDGEYVVTSYATDGLHGFATTDRFVLDAASPTHEALLEHAAGANVDVLAHTTDGSPVAGATVSFLDEVDRVFQFDRSPKTNDSGVHHAVGVRPGSYRVEVRHPDFSTTTTTLDCRAGVPKTLRVLLRDRETSR